MDTAGKWIFGLVAAFAGIAFIILAVSIFVLASALTTASSDTIEEASGGRTSERVAIISITNEIMDAEDIVRQLKKYRKRSSVKAIVLRLDSPGGAVVPSHEIYEEVRRTRNLGTPVVVSMGSVAASGAYYIACGANRIVANPGSVTGSIGVISSFPNISRLMDKIGIDQTTIKSGELKDAGSPLREMTPREKEYFQHTIDNIYEQFLRLVIDARGMVEDSVRMLADGRVYTGEQAWRNGLVDTLGTLQTAITVAGMLGKIQGEPRVVQEVQRQSLLDILLGTGTSETFRRLGKTLRSTSPVEYKMQLH